MTYDLAIIGGGPAGVAAGVYAARKHLKTILITKDFENQSSVSDNIQNWIGTVSISGQDLVKSFRAHLNAYAGEFLSIKEGDLVTAIAKKDDIFSISLGKGETVEAKTILVTVGSRRRKLEVPGAEQYDNKGLTYCATCDGPLFANTDVAVIGGGNAAFETVAQLTAYCSSVTLLHRNDTFRADNITVEKIKANSKVRIITNAEILEVRGDGKFATGLTYKDKKTGEQKDLAVAGIFVEIGALPNGDFLKDIINIDEYNRIVTDPRTQRTSTEGIWAAGDCTDGLYHQNNIAAGDAVKALEDIYGYLHLHR